MFIECNVAVVLLVYVEVLDESLMDKIVEHHLLVDELLDVLLVDPGDSSPHDDVGATESAAVAADVDAPGLHVGVDGHENVKETVTAHQFERFDQFPGKTRI